MAYKLDDVINHDVGDAIAKLVLVHLLVLQIKTISASPACKNL